MLSPVPNLKTSALTYSEDGSNIDSGNLDELIHEFVPRAHYVPPEDYQFTFLLASRLFMTPNRLLSGEYILKNFVLDELELVSDLCSIF